MSRDKQIDAMYEDVVEVFDEEYGKRNLITPQYTAEKLTAKGYRKSQYVAREIFEDIKTIWRKGRGFIKYTDLVDLERIYEWKYTEGKQ